jgi:hypothetical protein
MNERAVFIAAAHVSNPCADTWVFDDAGFDAFCKELILECCTVIQQHQGNNPLDSLNVIAIKEHFGIEPNEQHWKDHDRL